MTGALLVRSAGPGTTFQDLGRRGWLRFGVPTAGAMDPVALHVANALVGNPAGEAAVEFMLQGGAFTVEADEVRVAVTGAEGALAIDGQAAAAWRSYRLHRGQELHVGPAQVGVYSYLAVAGGFALPAVLGSLSTHVRSGIGGFEGRALRAGDRLALAAQSPPRGPDLMLPDAERPRPRRSIRIVLGPQDDYFTESGIECLLHSEYQVTTQADRMGLRLSGPKIEHAKGFNIISDGIAQGSIQVPGAGEPILLMADRQSTGGYPKIATAITADLPSVSQCRPGSMIGFVAVTIEDAQEARRTRDIWLTGIHDRLRAVKGDGAYDLQVLMATNLISGAISGDLP